MSTLIGEDVFHSKECAYGFMHSHTNNIHKSNPIKKTNMFVYVLAILFLLSVLFVAFEHYVFKMSTLKQRLSQAIFIYIQNPVVFILFLGRAFFFIADGRFTSIGVQFLYFPCAVFTAKLFFDLCMRNSTFKNYYTIYVADNQRIQNYWTNHLMPYTWALRFFYGISILYGCFHFCMLAESMNKHIFELEQLFPWSQETLFRVDKL